ALATTPGDIAEPTQLNPLLDQHELNTAKEVTVVVADRQYGTAETYCSLIAQGVRPHMAPMVARDHKTEGYFSKDEFRYDSQNDVYVCPVGHRLRPGRKHERRRMTDYVADRKVCA